MQYQKWKHACNYRFLISIKKKVKKKYVKKFSLSFKFLRKIYAS